MRLKSDLSILNEITIKVVLVFFSFFFCGTQQVTNNMEKTDTYTKIFQLPENKFNICVRLGKMKS